jgi:cell wall assembly regulator SMI1
VHEIEAAERVLGVALPESCRAAYLTHDGCRDVDLGGNATPSFFVGIGANWNSLSSLILAWECRQRISQGARDDWAAHPEFKFSSEGLKIRQDWWNARALPIGSTWSDRELLVDLEPGPVGTTGQLVQFAYESAGLEDTCVIASSFDAYLLCFVERMEQGTIAFEAEKSWVNTKTGEVIWDWVTLEGL